MAKQARVRKPPNEYDRRRLARRDELWPDAAAAVFDKFKEDGWFTLLRTVPMICTLIKVLGEKSDPSRVYLELWARQRDDGFVTIDDQAEFASVAGYYRGTTRSIRSLREALERLVSLGFIRTAPKGMRKHAYVLILHPHDVVQQIHHRTPKRIPEWWWSLFTLRLDEVGTRLRPVPTVPSKKAGESGEEYPESLDES